MRFAGHLGSVVALARTQIGYVQRPGNRTKYGEWFGWNGVPWCAIYLSWLFGQTGHKLPPLSNRQGAAYVPTIKSHAQKMGQWRNAAYNPKPGDLVVFWFTSRPDHVGVVGEQGRLRDGRVHSIEGNTGADARNGGRVLERFRGSGVHGFVVVDDLGGPPQPTPPPATKPEPQPVPLPDIEDDMQPDQVFIVSGFGIFYVPRGLKGAAISLQNLVAIRADYAKAGTKLLEVSLNRQQFEAVAR